MLSADYRLAQAMMEQRMSGVLRRTESRHLLRQAGVEPEGRLVRRVAGRVALLLVVLGARLVRLGLPPYQGGETDLSRRDPSASPV